MPLPLVGTYTEYYSTRILNISQLAVREAVVREELVREEVQNLMIQLVEAQRAPTPGPHFTRFTGTKVPILTPPLLVQKDKD